MRRLSLYVIWPSIIALLVLGCSNTSRTKFENKFIEGRDVMIKRTFDKKGNILTEEILGNDSIRNGYYKEFILGKVKDSGNYIIGRKEGTWYHWDLAGDVIKTENWFQGKQFGEQIDYYARLKLNEQQRIYKYSFHNVGGEKIFESKFDLDNKLLSAVGKPIYCTYNSSVISAGNSYELICFFGVPIGFDWRFSIKEIDQNKQAVLLEKYYSNDRSNNEIHNLSFAKRYFHSKKYLLKGEYSYLLFLQIKSLSGQILYNDSTSLSVSVQ